MKRNPALGLSNLPSRYGIRIEVREETIYLNYYNIARSRISTKSYRDQVYGQITLSKDSDYGPCLDAWMVSWSETKPGWGPFLYDVAIELATQLGGGLMADRRTVSEDAHSVWSFYQNKRGDVGKHQLDNLGIPLSRRLTPKIVEDDCSMDSVYEWSSSPNKWFETPESKVITKEPPTLLKELENSGRIIWKTKKIKF